MPEQFGEKTHEATPYRRQQARQRGQVAKSQDLGSALLLLLGLCVLMYPGQSLVNYLAETTARHLRGPAPLSADRVTVVHWWNTIVWDLAQVLLPSLGLILAVAAAVSVLQTGFVFVPSKLAPDVSRISPLKGVARIFSLSGLVRLGFGLFKIAVIGGVAFISLYDKRDEILALPTLDLPQFAVYLIDILFWTTLKIAAALLLLALLDFGFQRWKYEQDLRMTTQELKEEMKQTQGNPETAQRRKVMRQLARQQIAQVVPDAEFVLTNPTELALAIAYDPAKMNAPVVSAKGAGTVAQRIRRIALEHGVPIIERKPLAQALYKLVEVNEPIPRQHYEAVGEVLRYVYELKGKPLPGLEAA